MLAVAPKRCTSEGTLASGLWHLWELWILGPWRIEPTIYKAYIRAM